MPIKTGLVLKGTNSLETVCRPIENFLRYCYVIIDCQQACPPFDYSWRLANEKILQEQFFHVPELRSSSASCWRPRTLPKLAAHFLLDEWTHFFAFESRHENEARVHATKIANTRS